MYISNMSFFKKVIREVTIFNFAYKIPQEQMENRCIKIIERNLGEMENCTKLDG